MKKLFEIRRGKNLAFLVCGRYVFTVFNHGLIRFAVSAADGPLSLGEKVEVCPIDETNLQLCAESAASDKLYRRIMKSGEPIRAFAFRDRDSGETMGFYWLFLQGACDLEYRVKGDGSCALISYVFVYEKFRGQRFMERMFQHAFAVCREEGVRFLYASVRRNNASAWKAYGRIGYEEMGSRRFLRVLRRNIPPQSIP